MNWQLSYIFCVMYFVTASGEAGEVTETSEEEYTNLKVRLGHLVYSERTESDIMELTHRTLQHRRLWIKEKAPTGAEILRQFPRFVDTPSLVSVCNIHSLTFIHTGLTSVRPMLAWVRCAPPAPNPLPVWHTNLHSTSSSPSILTSSLTSSSLNCSLRLLLACSN